MRCRQSAEFQQHLVARSGGYRLNIVLFFRDQVFLHAAQHDRDFGQAGTLLLACLGASFVILMGSIDLSVGAIVLLVGAVTVQALNAFGLGAEAIVLSMLVGALSGWSTGRSSPRSDPVIRGHSRNTLGLHWSRLAASPGQSA